jgi:2-iminobutanoate/2-iminopropanoate deaminase
VSADLYREVFLDPVGDSRPDAVQVGDVVFAPFVLPRRTEGEATGEQLADVLSAMDALLGRVGAGRGDVARVTVFMRDVGERPVLNEVWARWYPDPADRPPHKYVPAPLPSGVNVAIQILALLGGRRQVLEIPGLRHGDPMSMGARIGNLVTSSRIFADGTDPDGMSLVLERAATLMGQAGGAWADVTQATVFVGDAATGDAVERRWETVDKGASDGPVLHVVEAPLGGSSAPRIEVMGVVANRRGQR